jgi:hypothetical protein
MDDQSSGRRTAFTTQALLQVWKSRVDEKDDGSAWLLSFAGVYPSFPVLYPRLGQRSCCHVILL